LGEVVGEYVDNAVAVHGFGYIRDLGVFARFAPNDASRFERHHETGFLMIGLAEVLHNRTALLSRPITIMGGTGRGQRKANLKHRRESRPDDDCGS
jgi:hypothetical protein